MVDLSISIKDIELTIDEMLQQTDTSPVPSGHFYKKNYWALLRNVIKAIHFLRNPEVGTRRTEELCEELHKIPTDRVYQTKHTSAREATPHAMAIKDMRRELTLFRCAESGAPEDLETIKDLIEEDPYRYMVDPSSPLAFINKKNTQACTSLYIACKHGNTQVVKLLLHYKADHQILSIVDNGFESCLEVAARWGHLKVVEELLVHKWTRAQKAKAAKCARSQNIQQVIKAEMKKGTCCWSSFCLSSEKSP